MTLLAVERIKLFTTRSPWWSALAALAVTIGFAALMAGTADETAPMDLAASQFGYGFGVVVVMVMAALAVTTEYRFSTMRATFLAVPNRTAALLAKTVVVAVLGAVIGTVAAFGSLGMAALLAPEADLALDSPYAWRAVAGVGLIYFFSSIAAVAVGTLIRHSAGAISVLLIYSQLLEGLVQLIPNVGDDIYKWLPFNVANNFITGDPDPSARPVQFGPPPSTAELSPWWSLAYFAGFALVLLILSIVSANKRDA